MAVSRSVQPVDREAQIKAVDAIFAEWDTTDSPGCAVGIIRDGEVLYTRGYGMASLELGVPIGPESVFHVASVSKQFCAIPVAMLAAEGKLSLDDDIRTHVPEMPEFDHTVTVRQLIHHTNGLRDQYALFRMAGWRDGDAQTFADVLDFAYNHRRLNFTPDSQYAYCNTSYTLLALIVQRVSGQSLREFADEHFFGPLGMTSSRFLDDRSEVVPKRANAYTKGDGDNFRTLNANADALGAICVYTSVEDLLKWVRNYKERTVAGNVLDDAMTSAVLSNGEKTHYGYGLTVDQYRGLRTIGHAGVDAGYRSQVTWFPEADFGVVVLANLATIKPAHLANQIADIYLADMLGDAGIAAEPEITLAKPDLEKYAGTYIQDDTRQVREIEMRDDHLVFATGWGFDPDLIPVAPNRFRVDTPAYEFQFADEDGLLLREIATNGRVTTYRKVEPVTPTVEELAGYVGVYHCPDIDTNYRVYLRDGKLHMKQRKGEEQELKPASEDVFIIPMTSLWFRPDAYGNVAGFELFNDRNRYLGFDRL